MEKVQELHVIYKGKIASVNDRLGFSQRTKKAYPRQPYANFKKALAWEIKIAMGVCTPWPYPIKGPVKIRISATLPPRMDLDNVIKPILDAAQLAGAVENDHSFTHMEVNRIKTTRRGQDSMIELWISQTGGSDEYRDPYKERTD